MALRVLGISTSPRRDGNSDRLLREALAGAEQAGATVEYLRLCDYRLEGCSECGDCASTGDCSIQDDYPILLDKMLAADRIAFATPVFFMTVGAQAKLLIDRGQCLWVRQTVLHRP
ncbi:MAG: flavodoxin family protein, partial [Planctomycetes bacterium]|nr:flavodoxin family protein [Planctomycetota bacterium]